LFAERERRDGFSRFGKVVGERVLLGSGKAVEY